MVWSDCVNSPPLRGSAIRGCKAQLHLMVVYPGRISACDLHQGSFLEPTDLSCSGCFHCLYWCLLPFTACPCHEQLVGSSTGICVLVTCYSSSEQGMVEVASQGEAGCCIFFFIFFLKAALYPEATYSWPRAVLFTKASFFTVVMYSDLNSYYWNCFQKTHYI